MKRLNTLLFLLAGVQFVLPFLLQNGRYEPHRDEFLYLAEAHHLAWGYMEAPPLLSLLGWITNHLGTQLFLIKMWPALFGCGTFILAGTIALKLGGKVLALLFTWFPFVFGAYLRLFFLFQPNFLEVFFYTAIAFCWFQWVLTQNSKWIYISGIALGIGLLSKASISFYAVGLLTGLLLTQQRKVFTQIAIYIAALIAIAIFLPHFIWQYRHHFPVLHHMELLQKKQLVHIAYADFIKGQLLLNISCIYIWLVGLYWLLFSKMGRPFRLFGWAYLTVIVLLLVLHGKDYYALGLYPILFAFGGYQIEQFTQTHTRWLLYPAFAFTILIGLLLWPLLLPVATPKQLAAYYSATHLNKSGLLTWEDQQQHSLPQDFADMIGWKSTTQKLAEFYNHLPADVQQHTIIFCRNYGWAGAVNFYGQRYHLPEAYSDEASFLLWLPKQNNESVNNIILLAKHLPDANDTTFHFFEKYSVIDSLNNAFARENGTKIIFFQKANPGFNHWLSSKINSLQAPFNSPAVK